MYGYDDSTEIELVAATVLQDRKQRQRLVDRVRDGVPLLVYFQSKLGGEIRIGATDSSPEFALDATIVELEATANELIEPGRYGIIEIQTMDFHGTYGSATKNLRDALRLHGDGFPEAVKAHPEWISEKIEGPNIANVFKRTFYQMMFKFQIGAHEQSAGCVLAIPRSVWDSWRRHLGGAELLQRSDGTWQLGHMDPTLPNTGRPPAWIYIFDIEVSAVRTPNDLNIWRVVATDARNISHHALELAPEAALAEGGSIDRLAETIHSKLSPLFGPLLAPYGARSAGRLRHLPFSASDENPA